MSMRKFFKLMSVAAMLVAGCQESSPADEKDVEGIKQADGIYGTRPNDPLRRPPMIDGQRFWGIDKRYVSGLPSGEYAYEVWGGTYYHNATLSYYGMPVVELTANNSAVTGKYKWGTAYYTYTGTSVAGTRIDFTADNGLAYQVKFDTMSTETNDHSVPYTLYSLRYKKTSDPDVPASWISACKNPDTNADEPAMIINRAEGDLSIVGNAFTNNWLTFSCKSDTLTQCVNWGYAWWDSSTKTTTTCYWQYEFIDGIRVKTQTCEDNTVSVSLLDYFDACRQVKRADYCGDNQPQTQRGRQIQLYEKGLPTPIHSNYPTDPTILEGGWSKGRTLCINDPHRSPADPNWWPAQGCRWEFWTPGQYPMPSCSEYTGSSSEPILLGSRYVQ